MAYFKKITMGHPVIMGRKTHESIGRPLPGRQNIIISRDKSYQAAGCEVVQSLDEALAAAVGSDEVFIIGGSSIYDVAMSKLDKIYLTRVKADIDGDKFFDFDGRGWRKLSSELHEANHQDEYAYELQVWARNH